MLWEYYNTDDNTAQNMGSNYWQAQTFTTDVNSNHTIASVKLKLYRSGSPGTITVSIRATTGGHPSGLDLTSGTIDGNSLTTSTLGLWYEIKLTPYSLTKNTKYAIVARSPNNYFMWRDDSTTPLYAGGNLEYSSDSGVSWTTYTAYDFMFEVWDVSTPTVTTQAVTVIEETTATGNGNITATGGENATKRGICWNTTGSPTVADSKTEETGSYGTGAFTEAMTDLSPGTLYYVRAYAYNTTGYGYGDTDVTFTTKPNDPSSLSATAISATRIDLAWTRGTGAVNTKIQRRSDGVYPTSVTDGTNVYNDTGSSYSDTSVVKSTTYLYRAWSYTSPNYSDGYSSSSATTPSEPTVTTEAVSSIEEVTSTGNGTITVTGGEDPSKRGICWNTTGTPTISDPKTEESPGPFSTGAYTELMTSLLPGTLYHVRAYGYNSAGYGYGNEVTFTTKPNDPSSLASTGKTKNSISLSWTKGTGAEKTMIRYRTDTYPTNPTDGTQGYFDTGSIGTVNSLSSGQIYYFRAWSYCTLSPGNYSDGYSSITEYSTPGDPSSLGCTVVSSSQINLAWSKGTGGDITMVRRKVGSYPISVSDGDQVYLDTGINYNNTGLTGGVHYYYRAWTYDTDSGYYSDSYSQDNAITSNPTLPVKIYIIDKDNNLFRVESSTLTEEKRIDLT